MEHPADPVAESFRLLRTNLAFMDVDGNAKSLLVTSSLQGEGKSVTVANLAVTLALAGKKVIIVDADLRRPRQHKLFGLENEVGASNVAVGDADLVATLQSVQVVSLDGNGSQADFTSWTSATGSVTQTLGAARAAPSRPIPARSSLRSGSSRMLASLRDECDVLLVDSPAMLAVGDTAALASEVDGLIFLVDMEKARRPGHAGGRRPALPFAVCHDGRRRAVARRQLPRQVLLHLALPVFRRCLARQASRRQARRPGRRAAKLVKEGHMKARRKRCLGVRL